MEAEFKPFFFALWRQHTQVKKPMKRVGWTDCRDFIGLYGRVAFQYNILVGFVRPRFKFFLMLPK